MLDTWKGGGIMGLHVGHLHVGHLGWRAGDPSFPSAQHEDPLSQPDWKGGWGNGSSCWTLGHLGRRLEY